MELKSKSIRPKEKESATRERHYLSYIEKFPLYSTLLILKEYEDAELYEECAIIRDALITYNEKYKSSLPKGLNFPKHISTYLSKEYQSMLKRENTLVGEELAQQKATLIKLNLPVNGL